MSTDTRIKIKYKCTKKGYIEDRGTQREWHKLLNQTGRICVDIEMSCFVLFDYQYHSPTCTERHVAFAEMPIRSEL